MIEESLVYICADAAGKKHIGCGVTIEGGLIATCRHVWAKAGDSPFVRFPRVNSAEALQRLTLIDDCEDEGDPPDCVLLRPALMPNGVLPVSLALKDRLETGEAECCAYLQRNKNWREVLVRGTIYEAKGTDGRRQFSGQSNTGYWFAPGSSGSPLFKQGGQQLAAILSLSELGANDGKGLLEAFVVPASVMLKYVRRVQAKPITQPEQLSRAQLDEVLREIGAADVPSDEALGRLKSFIQDAKAQAAQPPPIPPIVAEGGDVPAAIAAAREKAGALDASGALQILEDRLAQESKAHEARMAALLREKAAIERLSFRSEEAIATMLRLLALAPAAPWDWINLGDLYRTQGRSTEARRAFEKALEAAEQQDPTSRDVGASHERIGGILYAQGNLVGALAAYQRSMDLAERLAASDPTNTHWQRDLAVSHDKIGDILRAQGKLAEALAAYQRGMDIAARLAASDATNTGWQRDLSVSHNKIGDILQAQGNLAEALAAYQCGMDIAARLAASDPTNTEWQRDHYVSHVKIGDILQAQGNLAEALAAYQRGMDIAARLAASDPTNPEWQRDHYVSHVNIGDILRAQGNLAEALAAYQRSMDIAARLAASDPTNAQLQRDLVVSLVRLAEAAPALAKEHLTRALAIVTSLAETGRLAPRDAWMIEDLKNQLRDLGN